MSKFKLLIVVGTRPELIRLSRIINRCDQVFDLVLVHTGQNYDYELNGVFFEEMKIRRPNYVLDCRGTQMEIISKVLTSVDEILEEERPDAFLVLGDTNSCLAALSAKMRKIPVFHVEAGNRCFDDRVPEEVLRRVVDNIADVNLVYSQNERLNLLREGHHAETIHYCGAPMTEVLDYYREDIEASNILAEMNLEKQMYVVLSCHRAEHVSDLSSIQKLQTLLEGLSRKFSDKKIVFSAHPRTQQQIARHKLLIPNNVLVHKPFGFMDYNALQRYAFVVLSDSGTLAEESGYWGFHAVNLRGTQERPAAMDVGTTILSNMDLNGILTAISILKSGIQVMPQAHEYAKINVSEVVVRQLLSYAQQVNRKVWLKKEYV